AHNLTSDVEPRPVPYGVQPPSAANDQLSAAPCVPGEADARLNVRVVISSRRGDQMVQTRELRIGHELRDEIVAAKVRVEVVAQSEIEGETAVEPPVVLREEAPLGV